jgi:hypothetical protein
MTKLPAPLALKKYILEYAKEHNWEYNGPLNAKEEFDEAMALITRLNDTATPQNIPQDHVQSLS